MLIETGKESEAVLPRKRPPAGARRTRNWNSPCLGSRIRLSLINPHREAALRQLMGGAEPCDSAAKDRHSLLHFVILRQTMRPTRVSRSNFCSEDSRQRSLTVYSAGRFEAW